MNQNKNKISSGHNACAGCGQLSAVQAVMRALNNDTILVNATGCLEVTTSAHPQSSWRLPWIHSLFENSASIASGIKAALNHNHKNTKVVIQAGDGGTYDIGIGLISGMWERNENIVYICYDTEAYSNTGIQASGSTPWGANTVTTPSGEKSIGSQQSKKDMLTIALAHGLKYVAQSTSAFPDDISNKVKKALVTIGPSYIQILSPCVPGWKIKTDETTKAARLAVKSGLYPLLEYTEGKLSNSSVNANFQADSVNEYLKIQGRFRHLKTEEIKQIQNLADKNIERYYL
ncbi:MAG: thiamine pyrophosphate-dependent enzyme [Patescibacteria group bacterium]|nr:thiamine pyrophosphate-dependent enzyme [Patescibacteria group bacterium]